MPPSSKRRTRRRDVELSDADLPDSSPTRPSTKRRKVNGNRASPPPRPQTPDTAQAEELDSSLLDPPNTDIVESVINILGVPKEPTVAMTQFSNTKPGIDQNVQAYAKIAGRDWTYYVKKMRVNIGRPREESEVAQNPDLQSSPVPESDSAIPVDIDLGPSKYVSRHHASIFYEDGTWVLMVNGRNGARVNSVHVKRGARASISCGDVIEVSNTQMLFQTPEQEPTIDASFLERARRAALGIEESSWNQNPHGHPEADGSEVNKASQEFDPSHQYSYSGPALAPAPPSFKRASTPSKTNQLTESKGKPSPLYNRGMMMESTEEIDYSKDAAKDLKPPFSYAAMIAQAIFASAEEMLTLNNIYNWIQEKYAFYRHSQTGWQNSIRHNLSLNKAFIKVPRRTDEPGKGMKWTINPEYREEYRQKTGPRKSGHSSGPSSPASKDYSVFKTNSNNPGYDRSYEGQFSARGPQASPSVSQGPHFNSFPAVNTLQPEAYTPERGPRTSVQGRHSYDPDDTVNFDDGSPLPTRPRSTNASRHGLSSQAQQGSPPTLSSSYFAQDADDATPNPIHSLVTPVLRRQQPRLAPPSTARLPSMGMPTSSPAPFWTMANFNNTPHPGIGESSPLKGEGRERPLDDIPSSSPPRDGAGVGLGSPSKKGPTPSRLAFEDSTQDTIAQSQSQPQSQDQAESRSGNRVGPAFALVGRSATEEREEDPNSNAGFDLVKGFQPIGSFHQQIRNGNPAATKAGSA